MRTLLALTLVLLAACGSDRRDAQAKHDAAPTSAMSGPDPIVLRVPRSGGTGRAFLYGRPDSAVWTSSTAVPAIERVLAFDDDAGLVAFVDSRGRPGRIDLRLGGVSATGKPKLAGLVSNDGSAIYGVADGVVTRLTPTGTWSWKPPATPRGLFPQADGSLLVTASRDSGIVVWKLRPPDDRVADSVILKGAERSATAAGDRVYFSVDEGQSLVGLRPRDLALSASMELEGHVRDAVATPSGDRLYVTSDSSHTLSVVDRYADKVRARIDLPGQPDDLRMDPLGRYLLVRQARGDSAWVVAIGTDHLIGAVATRWLADLPTVAPDGTLALVHGNDVVFVDPESFAARRTVAGGAKDFWYFFFWNGFRPRAAGLDEPVAFQETAPDSAIWGVPLDSAHADSLAAAGADSARTAPAPPPAATPAAAGWMVSFAALLDEGKARELAGRITVDGQRAHVTTSTRTGTPVYRVVLGPYPARGDAERVGQQSGQSFWVFQGNP